jgi:YD repeat-containing protein
VNKQLLAALILSFLVLLVLVPTSFAQTSNPCTVTEMWTSYPYVPLPLGWVYTGGLINWGLPEIAAYLASCSPPCTNCCPAGGAGPAGSSPGGAPGGEAPVCGKPINLATGDTYIRETDSSVPGIGGGLRLSRTWHSSWPTTLATHSVGAFGPFWRSTYEEAIFMGSDNYLRYMRGDGSVWVIGLKGANFVVASPATVSATLTNNGSVWTLSFQSGEKRQFNPQTGLLSAIIDRSGNTTQLTYNSSNQLVTVTSAASQHLYFNYGSGTLSQLVTSVTSDFGVTLSYSYDAEGRLSQVTYPDQSTISYTYNSQSQITQVTDSNGKVLESHTYDSASRGLTSSQANGVNAVTVTYAQ